MNKYNPNIRNRRSIRLKGYDYSQAGLYLVTVCVQNRVCLFGTKNEGQLTLNEAGQMVESEWLKLPERFPNIQLDEFIVMPNHFHGIIQIVGATLLVAQNDVTNTDDTTIPDDASAQNDVTNTDGTIGTGDAIDIEGENTTNCGDEKGQPQGIVPTAGKPLGDMMGAFQSITTVEYIRGVKSNNWQRFNGKLWQRNYWERIIRNNDEYQRIRNYIINNPANWKDDKYNEL